MFLVTLQSLHFSEIMATGSLHVLQCSFALPALGFYYYHYLKLKDFFAKTLNDVRLDMGGKVYTKTKSIVSNRCDNIWNIYVGERVAPQKSIILNRCDTIWNIYSSEGAAPLKSRISNRCDTIGNCIVCYFCSVCNKSSFIFIE